MNQQDIDIIEKYMSRTGTSIESELTRFICNFRTPQITLQKRDGIPCLTIRGHIEQSIRVEPLGSDDSDGFIDSRAINSFPFEFDYECNSYILPTIGMDISTMNIIEAMAFSATPALIQSCLKLVDILQAGKLNDDTEDKNDVIGEINCIATMIECALISSGLIKINDNDSDD